MTKYIPKDTKHEVNVSPQHPLADFFILVVAFLILLAAMVGAAFFASDIISKRISLEKEVDLFKGDYIASKSSKAPKEIRELVAELHEPFQSKKRFNFNVRVHPSDQPNAYAGIGGSITLTKGLLEFIGSENELAFVICHEIAHHYNRDVIRGIGAGLILLMVQTSLGLEGQLSDIGQGLTMKNFTRKQETYADEFALSCVSRKYGHVAQSDSFFKTLKVIQSDLQKVEALEFLSTHPFNEGRLEHMYEFAEKNGFRFEGPVTPWPPSSN